MAVEAAPLPVSLLLLFLLADGTAGASPAGGRMPGMGGAPATGPPPPDFLSNAGADLSLVCTDFSLFPLFMSDNNAPCDICQPDTLVIAVCCRIRVTI